MNSQRTSRLIALFTCLMLLAAACGGDAPVAEVSGETAASTTEEPTTAPTRPPAPTPAAAPTPSPEPTLSPEPTPEPEPEPPAAPEPTVSPLDGLPIGEPVGFLPSTPGDPDALAQAADQWAASWRTDADAAELANQIIGFPFELDPPVAGQVFSLLTETDFDEDDGVWETRWRYGVESTEFPELRTDDESDPVGPAVDVMYNQTVPRFIASGLALQNTANTASDAHPSGVGSFQIYFRPAAAFPVPAAGLEGELDIMSVLMSVNLDSSDDVDGDRPLPGYLVGGAAVFTQASAGSPLVGAMHELLDMPAAMTLTRGRVASGFADPAADGDSHGAPTLSLSMTYEGATADFETVVAALRESTSTADALAYGSVVDGALVPEFFEVGLSTASTDLLVANRHNGRMTAWIPDADDEVFELTVRVELSPEDTVLAG